MLEGLHGEGVEAPVILWALARELRLLANISQQYGGAFRSIAPSARPAHRSGTNDARWSPRHCNGTTPQAGAAC